MPTGSADVPATFSREPCDAGCDHPTVTVHTAAVPAPCPADDGPADHVHLQLHTHGQPPRSVPALHIADGVYVESPRLPDWVEGAAEDAGFVVLDDGGDRRPLALSREDAATAMAAFGSHGAADLQLQL